MPEPLKFEKEERIKLGSDISEIWFYEYLNLCYSDKDLEDAREELKKIRLEMRDFALFCIERFIKKKVRSACEFYLRYKDKPELLVKEQDSFAIKNGFLALYKDIKIKNDSEFLRKYNTWLFKHSFSDVFTEKERGKE